MSVGGGRVGGGGIGGEGVLWKGGMRGVGMRRVWLRLRMGRRGKRRGKGWLVWKEICTFGRYDV